MNRILPLLYSLGLACSVIAQGGPVTFECEYTDQFEQQYQEDAYRLALRYIYHQELPDTIAVKIPQEYYELMLNKLAIARNETSELWQFEVFENYQIHTNGFPSLNQFTLVLDTKEDWVANWLNSGANGTGNPELDQLIKQFDLSLDQLDRRDGDLVYCEISTSQFINVRALLNSISTINGIVEVFETAALPNRDTDIVLTHNSSDQNQLKFQYNWGNCEKNCLYKHEWICEFNKEQCKITAETSVGDPLSVELFDFFFSLDVFPNPTSDLVNLHMIGPPQKNVEVSLFDAFGKKMSTQAVNTLQGQLDIEVSLDNLPIGIYFVSFRNGNTIHTERILKL